MSRRSLSWSEPWDWERAKQGVRAASRAMPFRRFAVYGLAIPLAAVPIWALSVGQVAWLLGAYAVGRHWRSEKTSA